MDLAFPDVKSKLKQTERRDRVVNCSPEFDGPLSTFDRSVLSKPIATLAQEVRDGRVTPISVLSAYGKAALKVHRQTNCLTEIMLDGAKVWAEKEINKSGPLAGIPVSLKDTIICKGYDTSVGYSKNCFRPSKQDGPIVRLLKDAGAIPYVKTALPISLLSFESVNDVWGRCTNPHNRDYTPGGSTGGEGALLAAGGSRVGIGSDVAGSVRAPAHFSGHYSLRCSIGRWPKAGVLTSTLGQEGVQSVFSPMARELPDLVYFTRSIIGMKPWNYDNTCHPIRWREDVWKAAMDKETLKVGVMWTDGVVDPSPACKRALQQAVTALQAEGHDVCDIDPPDPYEALVVASQLLVADGGDTFMSHFHTGEWNDRGARVMRKYMELPRWLKYMYYLYVRYVKGDSVWAGLLRDWHPKSSTEQWKLVARREAYKTRWFEWWRDEAKVDFILCPPNATPAVPHGGMHHAVSSCGYTFIWNLLDYCAGIVPVTHVDCAKDALPANFSLKSLNGVARGAMKLYDAEKMHGLPVAVQVVGRRLEEEKTLAHMSRLEEALDRHGGKYDLLELE